MIILRTVKLDRKEKKTNKGTRSMNGDLREHDIHSENERGKNKMQPSAEIKVVKIDIDIERGKEKKGETTKISIRTNVNNKKYLIQQKNLTKNKGRVI